MSEQTVAVNRRGVAIPGVEITYQATLIDGKQLAFVLAEDATISREDLDELLDRYVGASRRQQAIEELPLVRANLSSNRKLLLLQRRERAKAEGGSHARMALVGSARRNPRPMPVGDENAVAQFDARIAQIETQIKHAELRIPYLEALIDRREPPDPSGFVSQDMAEAAE